MWDRGIRTSAALGSLLMLLGFVLIALYSARTSILLHVYSPMDDAYIYMRYVNNIVEGEGAVWNQGESPTYGSSSLLYLGLLTVVRYLTAMPTGLLLQGVSFSLGIGFILALTWAIKGVCTTPFMRQGWLIFFLVSCFVASSQIFLYHTLTGMETTLSLLVNSILIGVVLRFIQHPTMQWAILSGVMGFICYETRPETGLYGVLIPGLATLLLTPHEGRKRLLGGMAAVFSLLMIGSAAAKMLYFGTPVPLSFFVKRAGAFEGYVGHQNWNPIRYLVAFGQEALPFLVILLFTAQRKHMRLLIVFLTPVVCHFIYLFTVVQIMGNNARYYYPALPFIIAPALITLDDFLSEQQSSPMLSLRTLVMPLILSAFLIAMLSPLIGERIAGAYRIYVLERKDRSDDHYLAKRSRELPLLEWSQALTDISHLVSNLPKGTVVAMSEVGYPGAVASQVKIVDLSGLNDWEMVHHAFSADALFDRRPEFIWMPHSHYTKQIASIISDPRFKREYDYIPDAFDYGIALRKDSPHRALIIKQLDESWRKAYPGVRLPVM